MPKLAEGEVGRSSSEKVEFTEVTSCLTVLVELEDGSTAGAHLSLMPAPGSLASPDVIPALVTEIGGTKIKSVTIGGYGDMWAPEYLQKSMMASNGDFNYTSAEDARLTKNIRTVGAAILKQLKFADSSKVTYKQA